MYQARKTAQDKLKGAEKQKAQKQQCQKRESLKKITQKDKTCKLREHSFDLSLSGIMPRELMSITPDFKIDQSLVQVESDSRNNFNQSGSNFSSFFNPSDRQAVNIKNSQQIKEIISKQNLLESLGINEKQDYPQNEDSNGEDNKKLLDKNMDDSVLCKKQTEQDKGPLGALSQPFKKPAIAEVINYGNVKIQENNQRVSAQQQIVQQKTMNPRKIVRVNQLRESMKVKIEHDQIFQQSASKKSHQVYGISFVDEKPEKDNFADRQSQQVKVDQQQIKRITNRLLCNDREIFYEDQIKQDYQGQPQSQSSERQHQRKQFGKSDKKKKGKRVHSKLEKHEKPPTQQQFDFRDSQSPSFNAQEFELLNKMTPRMRAQNIINRHRSKHKGKDNEKASLTLVKKYRVGEQGITRIIYPNNREDIFSKRPVPITVTNLSLYQNLVPGKASIVNYFDNNFKEQQWKVLCKQRSKCSCNKSGCLKSYCQCFLNKRVCGEKCECKNCENVIPHNTSEAQQGLTLGCQCTKAACSTSYCRCRKLLISCGPHCKCSNQCKN